MIPIHDLLNRIRWDPEFGRGQFEIGYYDRQEAVLQRVALQAVSFPEGERHTLEVVDEAGHVRRIPFHRVREVLKDGHVIWRRSASDGDAT
jgi:uncharacterized protein (UPF0248 family)